MRLTRRTLVLSIVGLALAGCTADTTSLDQRITALEQQVQELQSRPDHPTREEWLEVAIERAVRQTTDLWSQRIAVEVWAKTQEKHIVITITSANGQEELSYSAREEYKRLAKGRAEAVLEKYGLQNFDIEVQYI